MQQKDKNKKIAIVGDGSFAQIAFEYFNHDSPYEVNGFAVEKQFRNKDVLFNTPVVDFENIESYFPSVTHDLFIAITYLQLNKVRERLYKEAKKRGYKLANYISSKAFFWPNVKIGDNVFIFEDNNIQPFVEIGDNVILWSGNHIGHHSTIKSHCFISSHVVISGHCNVGENCFIGVNATIGNNINIAKDNLIGLGCALNKNTEENKVYMGNPGNPLKVSAKRVMKVQEE